MSTFSGEDQYDDTDATHGITYYYWVVAAVDNNGTRASDPGGPSYTSVSDKPFSDIPTVYSIAATYPNPFNPVLNATIGLPEPSELEIRIYNLLGKEVGSIADGHFKTGYHNYTFDASGLSSGIYFIRATVPGKMNEIRKVVLMK